MFHTTNIHQPVIDSMALLGSMPQERPFVKLSGETFALEVFLIFAAIKSLDASFRDIPSGNLLQ